MNIAIELQAIKFWRDSILSYYGIGGCMEETKFSMTEVTNVVYDALIKFHLQECSRCHCSISIEEYISINNIRRFVSKKLAEKVIKEGGLRS